jgi:succinoglycan biosynthesis protein ExoW
MIGVVIPYYQRTPGLLNRALRSVAAQSGSHPLRVYVVDDASPAPPEAELAGLPATFGQDVVILRQANAGPGAARNLALDHAGQDITAIAFLDSDDAWSTDHLDHVATALAAGADFFFADHQREDDAESRFTQCGYRPDSGVIAGTVSWCDARALFRSVVLRSPVGTSTVAIRRDAIGRTRFPPRLRTAGEDSLFWLDLLSGDLRAACGVTCEAAYGRGVSIFNHRSWGNAAALRTTLDQMRAQHLVQARFPLEPDVIGQIRAQCGQLDLDFCAILLACARRLQWDAAGPAATYVRHRPFALVQLPRVVLNALARRRRPG